MTADFKDVFHQFDMAVHRIIGLKWEQVHRCTTDGHRPDCSCAGLARRATRSRRRRA